MARDGLTEEAALKRMAVQPSNSEYVQHANVVFSTQWEPEFTQIQVCCLHTYNIDCTQSCIYCVKIVATDSMVICYQYAVKV